MNRLTQVVSTTDGVAVSLDVYAHKTSNAAVIICPGFFQSKDTPTFQQMSRALAEKYSVLAMDFRGHGRSTGLYTFSAREGADLEAVLVFARKRYQRIGILAFSLGGAIAINTIRKQPKAVQSLIAVSAPAAFKDIEFKWWTADAMRTGARGLEAGAGCRPGNLLLAKERPVDSIKQIQPLPVLFMHGTADVIVGIEHSRRLFAAASEPKRLDVIEGGGHAEALFRDDPQRFDHTVQAWFAPALGEL